MKNYLSIYAKAFNWSGFFLPKKTYVKCSKLYDFCRTVDQIVKNMWEVMNEFNIPKIIVDDLFDGVDSDLKKEVRIKTEKELLIYCYRVAGTVGLMMAKILNVKRKESLRRAVDLGIAMQLTNISRDVVEDEKKNRIYLFRYTKDKFTNIKKLIYEADTFYDSSFVGLKDVPLSCRFSIIVARRVYRQIGKKIFDIKDINTYQKAGKIYVSNFSKIIQTFYSLIDLIRLLFLKPRKLEKQYQYNLINEDVSLNERI